MKEILSLHIGQGGIQIGSAVWELLCVEHGIDADGYISKSITDESFRSFFSETQSEHYVPRAAFIDLEPTCVDEIRSGSFRHLFHPDQLIGGKQDAANNFARGYYSVGRAMYDVALNEVRKLADQCDNIKSLLINNTTGGGTGSGFGSGLLEKLMQDYSKKTKVHCAILPGSSLATAVVEPYNAILASTPLVSYTDLTLTFENEALYQMCSRGLYLQNPSYIDINRLVAQVVSCLTAADRFENSTTNQISELQTNLVPFPKLHFPIANYAPVMNRNMASHYALNVHELIKTVFKSTHQMVSTDTSEGQYIACSLVFRGHVSPHSINKAINSVKNSNKIKFVDWCPTGFKVGICRRPVSAVKGATAVPTKLQAAMFANHTTTSHVFNRIRRKYAQLYKRKAFIFWYISEGLEESELCDAAEFVQVLQKDYEEVGLAPEIEEPPEEEKIAELSSSTDQLTSI